MDTELTLGLPGVITTDSKAASPSPPSPSSPTASAASITTTTPKRSFAESIIDHQDAKWSFCFQKGQRQPPQDQIPRNLPSEDPVAPSPKVQAVGWPPVRSFRKNALASLTSNVAKASDEDAVYVKVSMDGAPFLRKIHLNVYSSYHDLASSLENMFSAFTIGNLGLSNGGHMSESKLKDLLSGSEFVPTYEDKDGDWMLVGDVPWNMFVETCKRLRIMKASDAIGLAPASKGNREVQG